MPRLDALYDAFRVASPVLRPKIESEIYERGRTREREEAAKQARKQERRAEEMRTEKPRESITRVMEEAEGSEYAPPPAPKNEPVGQTLRRSITELADKHD